MFATRVMVASAALLSPGDGMDSDPRAPMDPLSRMFLFPTRHVVRELEDVGMEPEWVEFSNEFGVVLTGWWFDGDGSDETVLVCMGNTGNMSYMLPYAEFLLAAELDVFLFDYQGFGWSEGVATATSLTGDARAAYRFLTEEVGRTPEQVGVFGISLGSVLALALGAGEQPGAVVVEDVFLPHQGIEDFLAVAGDNPLVRAGAKALQMFVLPAVDPVLNAPKIRAPVFFLHGENDFLLSPRGTITVSDARDGATRVWFLENTGHAPESLVVNDLEYHAQITRFLRESLGTGQIQQPTVTWEAEPLEDEQWRVDLRVSSDRSRPLQVTLARPRLFQFHRCWVDAGDTRFQFDAHFEPEHVSAVEFYHVEVPPDLNGDSPEGLAWMPRLSSLSRSLQHFQDFRRAVMPAESKLHGNFFRDGVRVPFEISDWDTVRGHLPDPANLHPRVRPRFARILAQMSQGMRRRFPEESLDAARALLPFLPENPAAHYELGNARIRLGYDEPTVRRAVQQVAGACQDTDDLSGLRELLRLYLKVFPGDDPPFDAEEVESVTTATNLERLWGRG